MTDGEYIFSYRTITSDIAPYKCSLDSTSTPTTAVLACAAQPSSGATSTFVICHGGSLAASESACDNGVMTHVTNLILGPAPQLPTMGSLSFVGAQNQLLGEVTSSQYAAGIEVLQVVSASQVWSLNGDQHLASPSGDVLATDGDSVFVMTPTVLGQTGGVYPYVCSAAAESTATQAVLACAVPGITPDFTLCQDATGNDVVQTSAATCDTPIKLFEQFTLTPP